MHNSLAWLTPLHGYESDSSGKAGVGRRIHGLVLHRLTGGILPKKVVAFPIRRWPHWSRNKATATIWANIEQHVSTFRAERTFLTADTRLK